MTAPQRTAGWFSRSDPRPHASLRLFCFPYAGGGAAVYREWPSRMPAWVDVCALQPPGRAWRLQEPSFIDVNDLATAIADVVTPMLDIPYLFFGHSLGALVAFETARELRRRAASPPLRLVVSARRAPHLPDPNPPLYGLPQPDLLREVRRRYEGGIPAEILAEPEVLKVVLPALRADLQMDWAYEYEPDRPLDCPIAAVGGSADRMVPFAQVVAWNRHTSGTFRAKAVPGDHFFINSSAGELGQLILQGLRALDNAPLMGAADRVESRELR